MTFSSVVSDSQYKIKLLTRGQRSLLYRCSTDAQMAEVNNCKQ